MNTAYAGGTIAGERMYFRLAKVKESEKHDLEVISLGSLAIRDDRMAHFDLTRIESEKNGDAYTLDFGGGYYYQGLYLSLGVALGRNRDSDENLFAYYPEVGLALDLSPELAITASIKRYHRLYSESEGVVMIGILIRQ